MQYSTGTVQYTNGGTVFIASADVDWTDIKAEVDAAKMVWIKLRESALVYQVASITTPAANAGHTPASRWEANIVGIIGDATQTFGNYILHWNFTPNIGLPIPNIGDVEVEAIMGRAFAILDATWVGGAAPGGGGGGQLVQNVSISAAGNTASTMGTSFANHLIRATIGAGTAPYTATITLPTTSRVSGDQTMVTMAFPASINPTIQIKNATSGGTTLWTFNQPDNPFAQNLWALFVFDAGAWTLEADGITS